ncbi:hypothetical protein HUE87_08505 [Candidatus Sulfurimonas marisnigri]|uniref:Uncharacterized protein n=1 Tax=Candidatus Sulfurimonas marisnigri TaxID=2740405 RepID=A0A7S7LYQ1_9BACT|nr:hypothetical protein [Candidatus Sulfurimonas marisnigri]QOY53933.1 hypothetical protein HUE87_08505 [Candidatus Sulfurimonas marisnigri]
MKTILIASASIILTCILGANELAWVDEQIEAIKPSRKGINISNAKNPFIFLEKNGYKVKQRATVSSTSRSVKSTSYSAGIAPYKPESKSSRTTLTLDLLINSSAMINGSWYKVNDRVGNYTLVNVGKKFVTLKAGDKELTLSTRVKNKNLKFKNK